MEKITAPYGFVPLSNKVVTPDWLRYEQDGKLVAPPVHDVPFKDGLSGTLELEIEAETPIFVRGTKDKGELPFQLPNGKYAIPGTSLRGALRNIIEIITFSRFSRVNNHRYAVRDLTPGGEHVYRKHMAAIEGGNLTPLVNAGWMTCQDDKDSPAQIAICDFAKVEYSDLRGIAKMLGDDNFDPGLKRGASVKYTKYRGQLKVQLPVSWTRPDTVAGRKMLSRHGVVSQSSKEFLDGQLVFTGQPQEWRKGEKRKKHHDFFFTNTARQVKTLVVSRKTFDDFEFGHSNRGQQNRLSDSLAPNAEWAHWKEHFNKGERVPVFFLTNADGSLRSFGLAMMFRLAYELDIHQAIANASPEHLPGPDSALDFSEGLFGTVRESKDRERGQDLALKGRVGISHAIAKEGASLDNPVSAILGGPKASYYPNYVEQNPDSPGSAPGSINGKPVYQTWMDKDARPRGWKRYKTLNTPVGTAPSFGKENDTVKTTFRPLKSGTKFTCHVDLHNLKPAELGALLWSFNWGGDKDARHGLGMARPLGYGRCSIRLSKAQVSDMSGNSVTDFDPVIKAFQDFMEGQVPGWASSNQIRELLALARPVPNSEARYQTLSPNEFTEAKGQFLALPSAAGLGQMKGWSKGPGRGVGSTPASTNSAGGNDVYCQLIEGETNSKGGHLFKSDSFSGKANLLPNSPRPVDGFEPGVLYKFRRTGGNPPQLTWLDPSAPPPAPKKPQGPPHRKGPGFRR